MGRRPEATDMLGRSLQGVAGAVLVAALAAVLVAPQFRSAVGDESIPDSCSTVSSHSPPVAARSNPCGLRCDGRLATFVGTNGSDVIRLTAGDDVIMGLDGDDAISPVTPGGVDTICPGDGNDRVTVSGAAVVYAGDGNDAVSIERDITPAAVTFDGGAGDDTLKGSSGNDVLRGGPGRDQLHGAVGDDELDGGPDRDNCQGGPGTNRVLNCENAARARATPRGNTPTPR